MAVYTVLAIFGMLTNEMVVRLRRTCAVCTGNFIDAHDKFIVCVAGMHFPFGSMTFFTDAPVTARLSVGKTKCDVAPESMTMLCGIYFGVMYQCSCSHP